MLARLASLRMKLLVAMLVAAGAGLVGSYLLISGLTRSSERTADHAKALRTARAIAREVAAGATKSDLMAIQHVLPDDQIAVFRHSRQVYKGPPNPRPLELTVTASFPGGYVVLHDHASSARAVP